MLFYTPLNATVDTLYCCNHFTYLNCRILTIYKTCPNHLNLSCLILYSIGATLTILRRILHLVRSSKVLKHFHVNNLVATILVLLISLVAEHPGHMICNMAGLIERSALSFFSTHRMLKLTYGMPLLAVQKDMMNWCYLLFAGAF